MEPSAFHAELFALRIPPEDAAGKPAAAAQVNIPNLPAANGPAPGEAKGPRKGPVFPAGAVEAEAALESLLRPELVRRQYGEL